MIPPFHWWRTVFWLSPAIAIYTIALGTLSIGSSFAGGRGYFAHWCARAWSWLILALVWAGANEATPRLLQQVEDRHQLAHVVGAVGPPSGSPAGRVDVPPPPGRAGVAPRSAVEVGRDQGAWGASGALGA